MRANEFINGLDEGWKDVAVAGAIGLGTLGAQGAVHKDKETFIQPTYKQAMSPAAQADSTSKLQKLTSKKHTDTAADQKYDSSAINMLSMTNPESEEILHRTAKAAGLKGVELAQFMAQTRHESADFSRMKEIGGEKYFNKLYDPKVSPKTARILGNTHIGDGIRYHGRGFIQITGRDNYKMAGAALGLPLEQKPELASKPAIAAKIAVWYWKTRVKPFISNFADTSAVTKKINPAMRGLSGRHAYFQDYKKIL
jgi:predicted chitinase